MSGPGLNKIQVPQLHPEDLFEKRRERDAAKLKTYNKILEQIYNRIKTTSREGGDPWLIYTCPPFILGLPKIDLEDCIVFLVYMLRQQNYEVRYTYPNLLYISWKHHEKNYILKGSPIMQTMLAAAQSTKPKQELRSQSSSRVRFADQIHGNTIPNNPVIAPMPISTTSQHQPQTIGRAPPKSTNSYQPPSSFLDILEKGTVAEPRKDPLADFMMF